MMNKNLKSTKSTAAFATTSSCSKLAYLRRGLRNYKMFSGEEQVNNLMLSPVITPMIEIKDLELVKAEIVKGLTTRKRRCISTSTIP